MRRLFADTTTAAACAALFPKTTDDISRLAAAAKQRATAALEAIYAHDGKPTASFANTARATDLAEADLDAAASLLSVVQNTAKDKPLREAARASLVDLESFSIESFSSNKTLYRCLKAYAGSEEFTAQGGKVSAAEDRYWLDEELSEMRRGGLELEGEAFDAVVALQKKLAELSTTFSTNVAEDATELYFNAAQLEGTPAPIIKALKPKEDGSDLLVVKLDYPTYFGIMKNCVIAETRKAVANAFENRAYPQNLSVLQDVLKARHQLATRLGYASFAALNLENKMIKSPENAANFIAELVPGLQKKWAIEKAVILENLHPSVVPTAAGDLQSYDIAFCIDHIKKSRLNVDETAIQEYFPMDATVAALFDIYQRFFDITFVRHENGSDLWDEAVSTLEVVDNKTKVVLGFVVLDLFPRDGKFTHACCHGVIPAVRLDDDTAATETKSAYSPCLTVVLANFPKATADRPALFLHNDVETFFHEFGHAIHNIMGRSRMATFAGTRVKRDFVELPSQMLEEWLWEKSILQRVSKHYKTGAPLPDALIDAKIASQNAFSGRDSLRQLQFATYSLDIFNATNGATAAADGSTVDTSRLFLDIQQRIMSGIVYNADSRFECAFGHLLGYGAGYYGYMYSKVLALDVFSYIRDRDGLLSADLGARYVQHIIGAGGGRDPNTLVEGFLERKPNSDAFLAKIGISKA